MKVTGRGMEGGRVSPASVLGILTSSIGKTSALVSVTSGHLSPPFFDEDAFVRHRRRLLHAAKFGILLNLRRV